MWRKRLMAYRRCFLEHLSLNPVQNKLNGALFCESSLFAFISARSSKVYLISSIQKVFLLY